MARINRAIELLAAGQPVYCTTVHELSYERGLEEAGDLGGLPDGRCRAPSVHAGGAARVHARPGRRRPDPERPSHARGDRDPADRRQRRADGARECLDDPADARGRRARAPALPRRDGGRGAGLRRGGALSVPYHGRGPGPGRRGWAVRTSRPRSGGSRRRTTSSAPTSGRSTRRRAAARASRSRTVARSTTPRRALPSPASPSPSGARATWACASATGTPMTRPIRPR